MNIKDFLPPVLLRATNRFFASKAIATGPKTFPTYSVAMQACAGTGYEYPALVKTVFEKTRRLRDQMLARQVPLSDATAQSLLAVLFALRDDSRRMLFNVLDFGGACGAHYFQIRPFLPVNTQVRWVVVETPNMVAAASDLATDELQFSQSIQETVEKLQGVDLVHSSGALQYVPEPEATLQELIACQPAFIFLNRLALSSAETFITVQESLLSANGPGVLPKGLKDGSCFYPLTVLSKHRFYELLVQQFQVQFELAQIHSSLSEQEIIHTGLFANKSISRSVHG